MSLLFLMALDADKKINPRTIFVGVIVGGLMVAGAVWWNEKHPDEPLLREAPSEAAVPSHSDPDVR